MTTDSPHRPDPVRIEWPDEAATAACARTLAAQSADLRHAVIALEGDLGAGKTTFVRHLLRALGVQGRIKSPTYAIVEPYTVAGAAGESTIAGAAGECTIAGAAGEWPVWHFDFYRFSDPREWEDAGLRDIFASEGLKLCEWPQRAHGVMPQPDLHLDIQVQPANDDDQAPARLAQWRAHSALGQRLLGGLAQRASATMGSR